MASYPPPTTPPGVPPGAPFGFDPRDQRRMLRDQERYQRATFKAAARAQAQQLRMQQRSLRRSSVVGPLFLIAIGVVFLLIETGKLSRGAFWSFYGRWWPLVLVAAGVVLLAEWIFDQSVQRDPLHPQYRRSIGGGVVFLLFLIGSVGFTAQHAGLNIDGDKWWYGWNFDQDNLDQFLGNKHESDTTSDRAFPTGGTLTIDAPHGDVTVAGTSTDGQMHMTVHRLAYASSDSEADAKLDKLTPQIETGSDRMTITLRPIDGGRASVEITVPSSASAQITANHGDIDLSGIKGSATVTANHGDLKLAQIGGSVVAHSNNSGSSVSVHQIGAGLTLEGHADDVTLADIAGPVSMHGEFFGTTQMQHVAGAVTFHTNRTDFQLARLDGQIEISPGAMLTADKALGPVRLTTRDRNITLDRVAGDITILNRNGTVDVTAAPALGTVSVENKNGAVRMIVPEHADFAVHADTTNGSIDNDFGLSSSDVNHRTIITGSIGSGGPSVRLITTNADISLTKAAVAPIAPMAPESPKLSFMPQAVAPPQPAPPSSPASPAKPRAAQKTELAAAPANNG